MPLTRDDSQDILDADDTPTPTSPDTPATLTMPTNITPNPIPVPGLAIGPPPPQAWLDATNLVFGEDGRLLQSSQSPEINKYISKAVRLVNLKIFFINSFPDPAIQSDWICQSLINILQDKAQRDPVAHQVNLRAQQDNQYLRSLLSMVRPVPPHLCPDNF